MKTLEFRGTLEFNKPSESFQPKPRLNPEEGVSHESRWIQGRRENQECLVPSPLGEEGEGEGRHVV